jgi:hypothetical protein
VLAGRHFKPDPEFQRKGHLAAFATLDATSGGGKAMRWTKPLKDRW